MDPPPPPPPPRFDSPLRAVSGITKQLQHTKHLQRPAQQRQQQQQQHQQQQQTTQRRRQQQHTQRRGSSSRSRPPSASSSSSSRRPGACRAQRSSAQRSSGSSSTSSRPPEARLAFVHPLWPQVIESSSHLWFTDTPIVLMQSLKWGDAGAAQQCSIGQQNMRQPC